MTAIRRKKVNVPTLIGRGITMLILIGLSILVLIPLVWTVCMGPEARGGNLQRPLLPHHPGVGQLCGGGDLH